MKYLDLLDLTLFIGMLVISAIIGMYFAYFAKEKQNTASQYLMGGRMMGIFPVSMSLIASYISGISILGLPAEMYVYGTQYSMIMLSEVLVSVTLIFFFLPVFYDLQITSTYEYLSCRFNTSVKLLGSCIFCLKMMLYIPIVIYVPALAFNQVTGISLHWVAPVICIICIFYTTLGGLKAVVWTDTFQILIMLLGIIVVLIIGIGKLGGFYIIFERAAASDRLEFFKNLLHDYSLNFDIRIRHTIWSVTIGNYFFWLASCSVNQSMVQRFLSLPSLTKAKMSVVILAGGIILIVALCCLTGLVIYATYHDCDPLATQKIKKADQLLPFFVMEIADEIPGLPGIFLSGVFSAALSTMSTGLNSMTGVIFEDIIKSVYRKPISEIQASFIMKTLVVIIGVLCVAMVFIVEQLGTLVQAGKSLSGITAGPLLGVFTLGMFFPWANSQGALIGGTISLIIVAWISIGSQRQIASGKIVFSQKPVSVTGCSHLSSNDTFTKFQNVKISPADPFLLFEISYLWYTFIGMSITLIVGNIVSYITGGNIRNVDKNLLTPLIRGYFTEKKSTELHQLENTYINKRNRKT